MALELESFLAALPPVNEKMIAAAARGLEKAALHVLGQAQEICPVGGPPTTPRDPAPGTLKASGTTQGPEITASSIEMIVGFNTVYAAVQHERLDFDHNPPGQAKYLEQPLRQSGPIVEAAIAEALAAQ